jgi:hypothetical protein
MALPGSTVREKLLLNHRVEGGCWRWTGAHIPQGYGHFKAAGHSSRRVHRVSYEVFVGPIPDGLQLDHLCGIRDCINPEHLEVVTPAENVARWARAITHCPQGHPFTAENSYHGKNGEGYRSRQCRICKKAQREASRARREEE